jgi:uncharacterized protein (DUF58 family)
MFFTLKAALYALTGVIFILLFAHFLSSSGTFLLFNLGFAAVLVADFLSAVPKDKLKIVRIVNDKLSLGTKNQVAFEVTSSWKYQSIIQLKDEIPPEFEAETTHMKLVLRNSQEERAIYDVLPSRRGQHTFGNLNIRAYGVLGLVGRQYVINLKQTVKVYPNIKDVSSYRLLARKGRLMEVGLKPSRIFGLGTDFEYLREYVPDDEFRKISWKASARRSKLITSQYQTERSQNIFIVIEAGRMMTSKIDKITKFDYAINAALLLSYVAMDKGDNVGLMVFSNEIKVFLPPKRGKKQLNLIIESLYNLEPEMVEPDYGQAIKYLTMKNKKRSLVVFFTDLIDSDVSKAIVVYSRSLYPAHLPMCVAISEPAIFEEADQYPETIKDIYQKAVAEDIIYQREQVKTILNRGGVLTLDVPPNQLTPTLITKYLSVKSKNKL